MITTRVQRAFVAALGALMMVGAQTSAVFAADTTPSFKADCPPTIKCVVVPAAFTANNGNIEDYGNYDSANRPNDMAINSIVVHDTEGDLQSVLESFQNPTSYTSTQYVIASDGTVYHMVPNKDVAWHAGNWWYNMHSIGIEHVGHAARGGTEYTPAMYWASAQLVRYLTSKYHIPRDRGHILGHDNVPAPKGTGIASMHLDPGPFWNWQNYMALIGAPIVPSGGLHDGFVTVAPMWPLSKQSVTGCWPNDQACAPTGLQPTNFVYLHTEPSADAPFFTDAVLGEGSIALNTNAARLFYGQTFALNGQPKVERGGIWYHVWANGGTGWFYSPWSAPTALPASGKYITPKAGKSTIPVYGRPSPEASAYPESLLSSPPASFWIPALAPTAPLPYTVAAGQRYKVISSTNVPNDHYYTWSLTADRSRFPYDHTVFVGETEFVQIQYGNRIGFVNRGDVDIH